MGYRFFDQYSILHFAVGVIMYFWGFSFLWAFGIHTGFELGENTKLGVHLINKFSESSFPFKWPGGKPEPDNWRNMLGDTVFFVLGYLVSKILETLGRTQHWYYE